jgi:beta-aspartyl-peptidase (threonine type)
MEVLKTQGYALALHGGAGTLLREQMSEEKEREHRQALASAARSGEAVLAAGGSALDAVVAATRVLEDSPLFNAGKGAVYTNAGDHELDASLMEGASRKAGAVCALRHIANPITLCREVMESEFVMLNGEGAEQFATEKGFELVENTYFDTAFRFEQLEEARASGRVQLDHSDGQTDNRHKYGTVGVVARDRDGHLAAATSTGGMTNKQYSRIGDSALIGSGTWADDRSCAISATGYGEYFIRSGFAARIASMVEYGKLDLNSACLTMLNDEVLPLGGDGGLVAIDKDGNLDLSFNSAGMYRAWVIEGEPVTTAIFKDDAYAHG